MPPLGQLPASAQRFRSNDRSMTATSTSIHRPLEARAAGTVLRSGRANPSVIDRRLRHPAMLTIVVVGWLVSALSLAVCADDAIYFRRDVQPLLAKHCLLCHGPDEAEAGLRLDQAEVATAELDSGAVAIRPGDASGSELLHRVRSSDEGLRMPPDGDPLTAAEVEILESWIESGAIFETHWAYLPVQSPAPPTIDGRNAHWARNPIDRFVIAGLDAVGVAPSPPADPATLVRRLYYDLVGLPPDRRDILALQQDPSRETYQALVDRLLASPAFGERWGRHWLDIARYADSDGYEKDRPRPHAWRYRDWVIDAINQDLPFDQFSIWQLAGDLLPSADSRQHLATAFHRQTLTNTEGGTDQEEFRVEATFDRTETTAAAWMGLTFNCARCHTHKYDQISQTEYYQLYAFFNELAEQDIEVPVSEVDWQRHQQRLTQYQQQAAALVDRYDQQKQQFAPDLQRTIDAATAELVAASAVTTDTAIQGQTSAEGEAATAETPPIALKWQTSAGASGVDLRPQEDGSFLAQGPAVDKDSYTLDAVLPAGADVSGLRLEVIPDQRLPQSGPGRAPNGNFVLTRVLASISNDKDFTSQEELLFRLPQADYSQSRFSPGQALQSDPKTGWAIGGSVGKPHQWSALTSVAPADHDRYLRIVLDQSYGGQHTLGRFRISLLHSVPLERRLPQEVLSALRTPADQRSPAEQDLLIEHFAAEHPQIQPTWKRLQELRQQAPEPPLMPAAVLVHKNRTTHRLERGDFLQPAEPVTGGVIETIGAVHPLQSRTQDTPPDRLDLARWLVDPQHPLTSRVTVNQIWLQLFGEGLVRSTGDFGVRGEMPTHPELLDWLADHFANPLAWSRKAMIRMIVNSATYRQASAHRPELLEIDPTNRLLARQNRFRVSAEVVWDLNLAVGGLLDARLGGPSVFPPLPPGITELSYANNFRWKTSSEGDAYRRAMYTFFKRTSPHPTLLTFDCPDSNTTRLVREISNTPLQALTTLNNRLFFESAVAFARRVLREQPSDDLLRLRGALQLIVARDVAPSELDVWLELLQAARQAYTDQPQWLSQQAAFQDPHLEATELAAWTATLRMMLNLDEFLVRE